MQCTIVGKAAELTVVQELPLYGCPVKGGFPSPAEDWVETHIDLNKHFVRTPHATYFLKVSGDSMSGVGIHSGDTLVVDKSLDAKDGDIVIAAVEGELTVKRLSLKDNRIYLVPENENYAIIEIKNPDELHIWGVVVSSFKTFRPI